VPEGSSRRAQLADRASRHRHLLAGSATLVVGAAVQALAGAVFWLVAARIDDTDTVGRATALFTSTLFLAYAINLGLPVSLARFSSGEDEDSRTFFTWAAVATGGAAALATTIYLLVVHTDATDSLFAWSSVGGPLLFGVFAIGTALSLIIDVRLMTLRRWGLVLARIGIVGALRFPLLVVPTGGEESVHLFAVAIAPLALSGYVGVLLLPRISGGPHRLNPRPDQTRAMVRYSFVNYLSTLAYQGPQFVLPVIVLLSVNPDANASFYVAFGITAVALYVPMAVGQALLAEGGKDGAHLRSQVRVVLGLSAALMSAAAVTTAIGKDIVTLVYGDDYEAAAEVLPLLVWGTVPWAFTSVFLTEARVLHRHAETIAITASLTLGIFVPAVLLVPDDGLTGAGRSFLFGNLVAAVVAIACHIRSGGQPLTTVPDTDTELVLETLHP
jgi:O-antigen/teichoic acid export membrane protein